jgi:hypothetical protein
MDKKAQYEVGHKTPYFIIAMLIVGVMFILLILMFSKYISAPVLTHEQVYITIYKQRFLSSPDCFAYENKETGNIYQGMIDVSKFTEERLNNCYKENKDSKFEFLLVLQEKEKQLSIQTKNYIQLTKKLPMSVLVYDQGNITKGILTIGIQGVAK